MVLQDLDKRVLKVVESGPYQNWIVFYDEPRDTYYEITCYQHVERNVAKARMKLSEVSSKLLWEKFKSR